MNIFGNDISIDTMIETIFGGHFTTIITIIAICTIRNGNTLLGKKKTWTEEDEARRIQQVLPIHFQI